MTKRGTGTREPEKPVLGAPGVSGGTQNAEQVFADPLLTGAQLTEEQRAYLVALGEVGMKALACRRAREKTGTAIGTATLRMWRKDAVFAEIEVQVFDEYWDGYAEANVRAVRDGRKFSGGEANLLMQQLNRSKPEEYLPAIQQQIHQTVTYRAEGEFSEEQKGVEEATAGRAEEDVVLVPVAPGKH